MAKNDRILTIDIGATSIRLCEFEIDENAMMHLAVFAYREYEEELSEDTRMGVVSGVLRQMLSESGVRAKRAVLSISGQSALIRFGKIPAGNYNKKQISQLARFEAQRNIPFAINEVIWDYQLIVEEGSQFVDVMSIVVKNDIVEQFTQSVKNVGLDPVLVDAAPIACYNAARANGLGNDGCVMIVNIGGRSTNLLFIEGERFYARSIPIAGHTITQQIAKEFGIGIPEAEELKRHHGFVALGGAYVEPVSEAAAAVSKIIRNVMARLHGEISRSINIYRSQQGGTAPVKMYLAGGSSILTYCDVFFSEKLGIPVEFFNPFQAVDILPSVDRQLLSEVAHMFSEPIGLAYRAFQNCPVEINLLPRSVRRQQELDTKKPYLIMAMIVIVAILVACFMGFSMSASREQDQASLLKSKRDTVEPNYKAINDSISNCESIEGQISELEAFLNKRGTWPMILEEVFRAKPSNVWIDSIQPIVGEVKAYEKEKPFGEEDNSMMGMGMGMGMGMDGMMGMGGGMGMGMDSMGMGGMGGSTESVVSVTKTIDGISILCMTVYQDNLDELKNPPLGKAPEFKFMEQEEEDVEAEEEESEDGKPAEEEDDEDEDTEENDEGDPESGQVYPHQAFIRNLRRSPLFNGDKTLTVVTRVEDVPEIPNVQGVSFEIQIKLANSMEVEVWIPNTASSMGGMGGMPGMGGGAGGGGDDD